MEKNYEPRTMNIALSTAWNALRHKSGRKMALELLDLGFDTLELNVHVTEAMIREIEPMVKEGRVTICSLHNYCPTPKGINREEAASVNMPIASPDSAERRKAVDQTRRTIEWAARLGAPAVVIHAGIIPVDIRQREALRLLGAGFREEARKIVAEDLMERTAVRQPYIDNVIASLDELSRDAERLGIKLGLETRYYYGEIPSLDEFGMIFESVPSPALGYWHDTGHAHTMEVLGIASQDDFLSRYGDRLIGMHLHDAVGGSDHRAVGRGEIDFAKVMEYVRHDTAIVLEVHSQASAAEVTRSREIACCLLKGRSGK